MCNNLFSYFSTKTYVVGTNTKHKWQKNNPQKKTALKRSVRKLLEGMNMFDGTNLIRISDEDQDT